MQRTVVVTGASAGVGRAIARELGSRGDRVALLARGEEGLRGAAKDVEDRGGVAWHRSVDVSDAARLDAAASAIEHDLGPIDVWINGAMVTVFGPVAELEPEEFERTTQVTYLGTVYGTMAALKRMKPRDRGHIVQVGSALSYRAIPLQAPYCASKYAIRGFCDSLQAELHHDESHVRLTMVQLPALNTPQFSWSRTKGDHPPKPVPPIYQPEVAARAVVGAIGRDRREIYVKFSSWKAILGSKVASGLLDRYLGKKGYSAQLRPEPQSPLRPDNLFAPVEGDFGAHGPFDAESRAPRHAQRLPSGQR